jgi:hypothetical protein
MQVKTFDNQQRLKQAERHRQFTQDLSGEQRAARSHRNRIGDLLGRLSFRSRTAPAESAS